MATISHFVPSLWMCLVLATTSGWESSARLPPERRSSPQSPRNETFMNDAKEAL